MSILIKHRLSRRSQNRMKYLHPDMVKVVKRASTILRYKSAGEVDFSVGECLRTRERQRKLYRLGFSKTMNSRHLKSDNGYCHAVDLIALMDGKVTWMWGSGAFDIIAGAMKQAARELDIPIEWGGDWKSFRDGPHFQLPWKEYPGHVTSNIYSG